MDDIPPFFLQVPPAGIQTMGDYPSMLVQPGGGQGAGAPAPTQQADAISSPAPASASPVPSPPSIRQSVLARIAAGEGKSYNQLFGGGTFQGYGQFPQWSGGNGPEGTSHAAGLYQFQPGTWQTEAKKLGLKDFSPQSQDAAAWDLAQTTYKANTGGRDLEADGNAGQVHWSALGDQWSSLKGESQGGVGDYKLPSADGSTSDADGGGGDGLSPEARDMVAGQQDHTAPGGLLNPKTTRALMTLQALAPLHTYTPITYDPFRIWEDMKTEGAPSTRGPITLTKPESYY